VLATIDEASAVEAKKAAEKALSEKGPSFDNGSSARLAELQPSSRAGTAQEYGGRGIQHQPLVRWQ